MQRFMLLLVLVSMLLTPFSIASAQQSHEQCIAAIAVAVVFAWEDVMLMQSVSDHLYSLELSTAPAAITGQAEFLLRHHLFMEIAHDSVTTMAALWHFCSS